MGDGAVTLGASGLSLCLWPLDEWLVTFGVAETAKRRRISIRGTLESCAQAWAPWDLAYLARLRRLDR